MKPCSQVVSMNSASVENRTWISFSKTWGCSQDPDQWRWVWRVGPALSWLSPLSNIIFRLLMGTLGFSTSDPPAAAAHSCISESLPSIRSSGSGDRLLLVLVSEQVWLLLSLPDWDWISEEEGGGLVRGDELWHRGTEGLHRVVWGCCCSQRFFKTLRLPAGRAGSRASGTCRNQEMKTALLITKTLRCSTKTKQKELKKVINNKRSCQSSESKRSFKNRVKLCLDLGTSRSSQRGRLENLNLKIKRIPLLDQRGLRQDHQANLKV